VTISTILAIIWVLAATITAFLPMRHQYAPAVTLLIAAPVIIIWLGYDYGWLLSLAATAGFISMFRNPLRYIFAKLRGQNPELPK